uniref:Uncharacterized protein n=1 Tax=Oryza brachyantha TaxID=4533 RepID=J3MNN4_ORYBR
MNEVKSELFRCDIWLPLLAETMQLSRYIKYIQMYRNCVEFRTLVFLLSSAHLIALVQSCSTLLCSACDFPASNRGKHTHQAQDQLQVQRITCKHNISDQKESGGVRPCLFWGHGRRTQWAPCRRRAPGAQPAAPPESGAGPGCCSATPPWSGTRAAARRCRGRRASAARRSPWGGPASRGLRRARTR